MVRAVNIALCLCIGWAGMARADLSPTRGVSFDQKLNAQVPIDLSFRDETGKTVQLDQYFKPGRPVVLVLAYYRCPQLCTQVLNGLTRALLEVDKRMAQDYEVVTVSFDARETPQLAAAKKRVYVNNYGRPGAVEGWHFLTGDKDAIRELADAVGFKFRYDERFDQFAHASGIMILTPEGRVARYLYGIEYAPMDVRLSLVEASHNQIGTPVEKFLLLCFHYDPREGKYGPTVMFIVRVGGVITVICIAFMVGIFLWREKRQARLALGAGLSEPRASAAGHA